MSSPDAKAARPPLGGAARPHAVRTTEPARRSGSLVEWFIAQELLRGPHLYVDYWANVLQLHGVAPEPQEREGLVDSALFRAGLDRPDFHVPRLRFYILLFLLSPLLLPLRRFRRLGHYRLRFASAVGHEVQEALRRFRLTLEPSGPGRVDVSLGEAALARNLLDPQLVPGFCSLFWAAYKLPLASFSAILLVAVAPPLLDRAGVLGVITLYWIPVGFPLIVLLLYLIFRDAVTAVLGALPLLVGRSLLAVFRPSSVESWLAFVWPLLALFVLYLIFDWLFMPRPVPPVLLLYTADGPGKPYARESDAPYWLEGRSYWVWRYLILSPAELNKFWERDWERIDLWIRADGDDAGTLEWVVSDLHYREIWIPFERLGPAANLEHYKRVARESVQRCEPGIWLLEVDADVVVHYPFVRGVTFIPERGAVPVRSVIDLLGALWRRVRDEPTAEQLARLDRVRLSLGRDILSDVPEFMLGRVSRHLLSQPWRYWRYPFGAATRSESRLYESERPVVPPPAADPSLQIKADPPATS